MMASQLKRGASTAPAATAGQFKKADAFLNLKINTTAGVKSFGKTGIPLYADNLVHSKIIAGIESGSITPDQVLGMLTCTYQRIDTEADGDFELVI